MRAHLADAPRLMDPTTPAPGKSGKPKKGFQKLGLMIPPVSILTMLPESPSCLFYFKALEFLSARCCEIRSRRV